MGILIFALGIFPLALAIDQPKRQCANFLTVRIIQKHSGYRRRRSPMEFGGLFDPTSGDGSGDSSDDNSWTTAAVSSAQTNPPTTEPGKTTDAQTNKPTTNAATTTIAVDTTTANDGTTDATTG